MSQTKFAIKVSTEKLFEVKKGYSGSLREAKVLFCQIGDGDWKLSKCDFFFTATNYTLRDWEFLSDLYHFIKDKLKELNK